MDGFSFAGWSVIVDYGLAWTHILARRNGLKPLLKKRNLDNTMLSNYRPISNLLFIGKIIETVVFNQLNKSLNSNGYLANFQSGFREHHSTEIPLIKIIHFIRLNSDTGKISFLVLRDLSAEFDTVDHNILLQILGLAFWDGTQMVQVILSRVYSSHTQLYSI